MQCSGHCYDGKKPFLPSKFIQAGSTVKCVRFGHFFFLFACGSRLPHHGVRASCDGLPVGRWRDCSPISFIGNGVGRRPRSFHRFVCIEDDKHSGGKAFWAFHSRVPLPTNNNNLLEMSIHSSTLDPFFWGQWKRLVNEICQIIAMPESFKKDFNSIAVVADEGSFIPRRVCMRCWLFYWVSASQDWADVTSVRSGGFVIPVWCCVNWAAAFIQRYDEWNYLFLGSSSRSCS